jgi:hypothetical protein
LAVELGHHVMIISWQAPIALMIEGCVHPEHRAGVPGDRRFLLKEAEGLERGLGRRLGHPDEEGYLSSDEVDGFPEQCRPPRSVQSLPLSSMRAGEEEALDVRQDAIQETAQTPFVQITVLE